MTKEEKPIYMGDPKAKQKEIDRITENTIKISYEEMMQLGKMASYTMDDYLATITPKMTRERALRIRNLRSNNSWRIVAGATYLEWGMDAAWVPQNNQLAGMALCQIAAELLEEDQTKEPWV